MDVIDSPEQQRDYTSTPTRPAGVRWGFISGMVGVILALALHLAGMTNMSNSWDWSKFLGTGITLFLAYKGFEQFKMTDNGGFMSLGQAMRVSMWMSLVSGLLTGLYMMLYIGVLEPDFKEKTMQVAMEQAAENGQDPEQVEQGMNMMSWVFDPIPMAAMVVIGSLFFGLIMGLIYGLIMRRDPPSAFSR